MNVSTVNRSAEAVDPAQEQYVWETLIPNLLDPHRLAIIESLIRLQQPLAVRDLAAIIGASADLTRYHCKVLTQAGVLEVSAVRLHPQPAGGGDDSLYEFPKPPQAVVTAPGSPE
ncbi:MAG TPA: winged helix-turn-helix domain-containing protein [Solirubrobacterales bacterium]|jgi:predicted transcriptional regulator|nr:winged helix-turn-helix domain-containing protein [Solirubrobacterales bacterium]